jgi:hypothetical protein
MANFCYTELSCEKEVLNTITKNYIQNGCFDFHSIIPAGDMDDRVEKWGTKWYPEDVSIGENTISFSNPWSPPVPVIYELARLNEGHEINFKYHDEVNLFHGEEKIICEDNILKIKGFTCDEGKDKRYFEKNIDTRPEQTQSGKEELDLARKTGYVQGVCECVVAVGEEKNMGKKLLTEMNVTREMAKKFAHQETYKAMEKGIFAQNVEQKIEHKHSVGR